MTYNEILVKMRTCINSTKCTECTYKNYADCINRLMTDALELILTQKFEIERLKKENKILSKNADTAFQDGLNEAQDIYAEQIKNEVRAEAIREFAERFEDKLAKLRDTYFERGLKDYSLVCEVIHDYLYPTLREMVGTENEN